MSFEHELACAGAARFAPPDDGKARDHYTRDRNFDLTHLKLDLAFDEKQKSIKGFAEITLTPIHTLRTVELDAVELNIKSVTLAGKKLAFEATGEKLLVALDRQAKEGQSLTLRVSYDARPKRGLYFVQPEKDYPKKPFQIWSQGESQDNQCWFPCYDSPNDKFTSEAVLRVNDRFVALSNGRLAKADHDKVRKQRVFRWVQDVPHPTYLMVVAVGEFDSLEEVVDGTPLTYYVPKGEGAKIKATFGETPAILKFFNKALDYKYPYAKYGQVVILDFMWGGMENTSLTTITDRALITADLKDDYDPTGLVAHEFAHQWFGDLITAKSWEHIWLNEGFASYLDPLYFEAEHGREEFIQAMLTEAADYFEEDKTKRRPIVSPRFVENEDMFDRHSYQKGAWVLHMLRKVLGDDLFWKALRHYLKKHARESIETAQFKIAVEEATGRSLEGFFKQWLYGAGHPEIEAKWSYDDKNKLVALTLKQTQKVEGDTPLFKMPYDVHLLDEKGKPAVHSIRLEEAAQTFHLPSREKPKAVQLDPEEWVLKKVKWEKPKEEWLFELANSRDAAPKIKACDALSTHANDPKVTQGLKDALTKEKFWGVRRAAAKALGALKTEEAREALLLGLKDKHPRVRRAVADALGNYKTEEVALKLGKLLKEDKSDYVAGAAALAIGKTYASPAYDLLLGALKRESHNDIIRNAAFLGFAELKEARGLDVAWDYSRSGKPIFARASALRAMGKLWEFATKEKQAKALDYLLECLNDRSHYIRSATLDALAAVNDPRSLAAISRMAESEILGMTRKTARDCLKRARDKAGQQTQIADIKKEMDSLKDESKSLKAKLAELEGKVSQMGKKK